MAPRDTSAPKEYQTSEGGTQGSAPRKHRRNTHCSTLHDTYDLGEPCTVYLHYLPFKSISRLYGHPLQLNILSVDKILFNHQGNLIELKPLTTQIVSQGPAGIYSGFQCILN